MCLENSMMTQQIKERIAEMQGRMAAVDDNIEVDEDVEIVEVDGLTLKVKRKDD